MSRSSKSNVIFGIIQLIVVVILIVMSFVTSSMLKSEKPKPATNDNADRSIYVKTAIFSPSSHRVAINTTGTLEAKARIDIVPQTTGRVVYVNDKFFEGGSFDADETLFSIDKTDYELALQRALSDVQRSKTALKLEEAQSKSAISEWKIFNKNKKIPDLVARNPQIAQSEAELNAAEANLQKAQLDLDRTEIKLPFAGKVIVNNIDEGSYVVAGQSVGQVYNLDSVEVKSSLPDSELKWLINEKNPQINIEFSYLGEKKNVKGYLKRGATSFDAGTRFASLSFGIENYENLIIGTFAKISIKGTKLDNVVKLPPSAIQKQGIIWQVGADNRLQEITPEVVYTTDEYVIVSNILDKAKIVTSTIDGAAVGMKIQDGG